MHPKTFRGKKTEQEMTIQWGKVKVTYVWPPKSVSLSWFSCAVIVWDRGTGAECLQKSSCKNWSGLKWKQYSSCSVCSDDEHVPNWRPCCMFGERHTQYLHLGSGHKSMNSAPGSQSLAVGSQR